MTQRWLTVAWVDSPIVFIFISIDVNVFVVEVDQLYLKLLSIIIMIRLYTKITELGDVVIRSEDKMTINAKTLVLSLR